MKNTNKEILEAEGKIYGIGIKIVVVYFDSDRGEDGKEANKRIKRDIQRIIENNEQEGLIIAGDFNGHLRMIDGRKDDENGKMIIGWGEEYGLITLNLEEKCEGTYTRIVKEQKTTVDYILVNKKIYDIVEEIEIDENRDILEGSDHVAMRMSLRVKETRGFQKPKWKKREYVSNKEEDIEELVQYIEEKWRENKPQDPQSMLDDIENGVKEKLTKTIRRREGIEKGQKVIESIWMTQEIRGEIKRRKTINRLKRNARSDKRKEVLEKRYKSQKGKVQRMIREAKSKYEKKLTDEIKRDKSGKKTWEHINKLSGKKEKVIETELYDGQGTKLGKEEAIGNLRETWHHIYKTGKKELTPIGSGDWKEEKIEDIHKEYRDRREKDREENGKIWIEGKKVEYTETTLKKGLKRLKEGKAAGPDKVKAEVYQRMGKSEICREVMKENFNKVIDMKEIPNSWKKTKTRMIPKKNKPQAKDLRPIAITNISYKLYMKQIGEEIEEHLEKNKIIKGNQIGFTDGGRTEYNHFVLQYIVEKAIKKDEKLIVIALYFKKAFDSINKEKSSILVYNNKENIEEIDGIGVV